LASASAAASLAHASQRPLEFWKPEKQPDAEKAAVLARGYQVVEPAAPVSTTNPEVYRAALSAARERLVVPSPAVVAPDQGYDQSAAEQVMMASGRAPRETPAVEIDRGALTAAMGALSSRRRAESAPIKPQLRQDAGYALSAATISHRASLGTEVILENLDPSMEASRIHNIARTNVRLYTASPPVQIEVEEQRQRDTLRAAAISMAKDMYAVAAAKESELAGSVSSTGQHRRSRRLSQSQFSWTTGDERGVTQRPTNLHEAAQKLAAEKLAKMQRTGLDYQQDYYGTGPAARSRLTITRRLRRRTSSDSDASQIDWERSAEIRNQMSSLQTRLHQIDEKKRRDRAELMEIARKNVHAAIHDMDEEVYARTGKPSPSMQREWEERAHERAKAESEARMSTFGRIPIGGQTYVDEVDVEAIARSRIQPTLDEITDRVEEQKAREIEQRLDEEKRLRWLEIDRQRDLDTKEAEKRQRGLNSYPQLNHPFGVADRQAAAAKRAEKEEREKKRRDRESQGFWDRTSRVLRGTKQSEEPNHAPEKSTEPVDWEASDRQAEQQVATAGAVEREREQENENERRQQEEQEQIQRRQQERQEEQQQEQQQPREQEQQQQQDKDRVVDGDTTSQVSRPFPFRSVTDELIHQASSSSARETGDPPAVSGASEPAAETVAAAATAVEESPTSTSPKGESRLKLWFKTKVGRRLSKSSPGDQPPQETGTEETASGFTGGAALTGATVDNPSGGPLGSHPVTDRDLASTTNSHAHSEHDHSDGQSESANAIRQWSTSTAGSGGEGQKPSGVSENGNKRNRLRMSFKEMMSRKSPDEPGSAGPASPTSLSKNGETANQTRPSPSRANTMERDELRDSFFVPAPPSLGTVAGRRSLSSARESRFSEYL
jgi:hypothetical protein